jgi:hypothetical protein
LEMHASVFEIISPLGACPSISGFCWPVKDESDSA